MRRRDISKVLLASAAAPVLINQQTAQAQTTCSPPCYPPLAGGAETFANSPLTAPVNPTYPPGNVLRWGADQTGVADSTQAIQYAINIAWASGYYASPWSGEGGATPVVFFPPGRYRITGTLTVPNGVTIRGTGHPAHTVNHTRIIMDSPGSTDNRDKPIFRFSRGTLKNEALENTAVTSSIEDLEFWFVTPGGTFDSPLANGIPFGAYPDGGTLMFDIDSADFRIINCVFQHSPAAIRIKSVPLTQTTRGDGWVGNLGVGIFIENCEFDASCTHIYATNSNLDLQFKSTQFFNAMHRYEGCTGKVVYQSGRFHGGAWIDAATVSNTLTKFELKGADIEIGNANIFLALSKSSLIDISQNAVLGGASGRSWIEVTDADGGCVVSNAINDSGYNSTPGSGATDNAAAIKLLGCQRILVASNCITTTDAASYNGFGILSYNSADRPAQNNFFNGNSITGTYNTGTFNGQNRYLNVMANDVLGINYSSHVSDNGYLSRNLPVQMLTLLDGIPAPAATAGKASLYIDSVDGSLKVIFANGIIKTVALDS